MIDHFSYAVTICFIYFVSLHAHLIDIQYMFWMNGRNVFI